MNINLIDEVMELENGTYKATIENIIGFEENQKVLMKFILEDGRTFLKFYKTEELERYPWSNIFKALNTNNTNDLIKKSIQFEISNHVSEKTGYTFSNIKKPKLI